MLQLYTLFTSGCSNGSGNVPLTLIRRKRSASYLPQGEAKTALASLSVAVFEVIANNTNRQIPCQDSTNRACEYKKPLICMLLGVANLWPVIVCLYNLLLKQITIFIVATH